MREFAKIEILGYKCHTCGCKNKMYTNLLNPATGVKLGYSLTCCNCGEILKFYNDTVDTLSAINSNTIAGQSYCIQPNFCPHKECPLYGTYKDDGSNADIPMNKEKKNPKEYNILDSEQLTVKDIPNPNFRYFY